MNDDNDLKRYKYMDSWLYEKSGNVVKYLSYLVDVLKNNEDRIPDDIYEEINSYVYSSLVDSTKVFGLICNSKKQSGREGDIIFSKGNEGLEQVLYKFGAITETSKMKKIKELEELIDALNSLILGDKINRTLVYEALSNYQCRTDEVKEQIKQLEDSIENVTMGKTKWKDFVITAKYIIPELKVGLENLKNK